MSDISDNFGPWMEEQPSTGFCVCCYNEKTQYEIECILDEDDIENLDESENIKVEERNVRNLPLVICRACMSCDDDDFFGIPLDDLWKDDENYE